MIASVPGSEEPADLATCLAPVRPVVAESFGARDIGQNLCCLRYFQLLERPPQGIADGTRNINSRKARLDGMLLPRPDRGRRRRGGRVGRPRIAANQSVQGAKKGGGRFRRRCADRDPDRGLERQRAVREERRRIARAVQHDEADDRRGGLPRHQAGRHQADRRISRQRKRLAQGRRALRRLDDVRSDSQQGFGRRSPARRHHPERQRCLHGAGRGNGRQRARLCRTDDQARARTRDDASRPLPIPTGCPIPATR